MLRGEETIRGGALKRGRRGSNGCSATGSRSTNNLVNEGPAIRADWKSILGMVGLRGIAPRVGLRVTRASTRACALSPLFTRARLVGNALLSRAKSTPLTRDLPSFPNFYSSFSIFNNAISLNDNSLSASL